MAEGDIMPADDSGQQTAAAESEGPNVSMGAAKAKVAKPKSKRKKRSKRKPLEHASDLPPLQAVMEAPNSVRQKEALRIFGFAVEQHRIGNLDDALRGYARTLSLDPGMVDAYNNLGVALRAQGKYVAAVAAYQRALAIRPDNPGVYSNMGNALREIGLLRQAREAHRRAIDLAPESAEAVYNLGLVYRDMGRSKDALECFEQVIAVKPDYVECRWDRALLYLNTGDLPRGFKEYEWRWRLDRSPPRDLPQPRWDGSDIAGKTILVHQEQGFGDMIQFVRYVPLLKERGAEVIVECQPELARLFASVSGVSKVVATGGAIPPFDVYVPMLSLGHVLGTTVETIPASIPYLAPPEVHNIHLPAPVGQLKVGICWAGKPSHRNDRNRSVGLDYFQDLAGVPGVAFYSLQKGETAGDLESQSCEALISDLGPRLQDFADTASVISQLDLVISVDTSVVHLAGALGRPVWAAIPHAGDWRWLKGRDDSPWYPTLRLFRQEKVGDWDGVFMRIREALAEVARNKQRGGGAR